MEFDGNSGQPKRKASEMGNGSSVDGCNSKKSSVNDMRLDEWVLCSIYKKAVKESTPIARDEGKNEPMVEPVGLMPPMVKPGGSMGEENQEKFLDITTSEPVNIINDYNIGVDLEDYIHHPFQNELLDIAQANNVSLGDHIEPVSHNDGTTPKMVEPVGFNMPPTESDSWPMPKMVEPADHFMPPRESNDFWFMPGEIQENIFDLRYLDRILPNDNDCIDASLHLDFNQSSE